MQLNNSDFQQQTQQDVYADIRTSYSGGFSQDSQDSQEFSLSSIQERLGAWNTVEEQDTVASADLRPSEQTLKMSYQREYAAQSTRTASKFSTKGKVAIASYAIVVLALIVAVTLCSVFVTTAYGKAISKNADYSVALSELEQEKSKVEALEEDIASLTQRAADLGYIEAAQVQQMEYSKIETRPAQNFQVDSNWFDALCDWLCSVFGG